MKPPSISYNSSSRVFCLLPSSRKDGFTLSTASAEKPPPIIRMSKNSAPSTAAVVRLKDYVNSPVHYAVATSDHAALGKLLAALPVLSDPSKIETECDSLAQERISEKIAAAIDSRDNPLRETPLQLAVRLDDLTAVRALAAAGADISLQNAAGWNALQEALLRRSPGIAAALAQQHHLAAWSKWRWRLPMLVSGLRRMRDFYMEMSFHFESSIVPFVDKFAPSDTYKIWKRDGNLRADTSLAGYDGLKIQRANQSFLFLNDGDCCNSADGKIKPGSLLVANHDKKKIYDAFTGAGYPLSESEIASFCNQTNVYRPGIDVTGAELIGRKNWKGQPKTESVGEWKARVYEMHNVLFTFRSRKVNSSDNRDDSSSSTFVLPLEIDEKSDDGFIVAENPRLSVFTDRQRRRSSFVPEERELITVSRKSVDIIPVECRKRAPPPCTADRLVAQPQTKDKEYAKNLRPVVWLTDQFPLKTSELLPLLGILANKIKAVRRLREVLTTTFPAGTFPIKVAIPVVPTVKVVITFTKFIELPPQESFYTPMSSPVHEDGASNRYNQLTPEVDPFAIPTGYSWWCGEDKNGKLKSSRSMKKAK